MKRALVFGGILVALIGIFIVLPALANYGRPGAMANDATRAVVLGSLAALAGASAMIRGFYMRRA